MKLLIENNFNFIIIVVDLVYPNNIPLNFKLRVLKCDVYVYSYEDKNTIKWVHYSINSFDSVCSIRKMYVRR